MFKRPFRSKLLKHGWLSAAKEGGNESQSWRRVKDNVNTAISDLVLLYEKLPQEKKDELYNLQNFRYLYDSLIKFDNYENIVKLEMANYLVELSVNIFKITYRYQNKNTVVLANVINDQLDKAVEICKDITFKEKIKKIELKLPKEELRYLASWNNITSREKINLEYFFAEVMDIVTVEANLYYVDYKKCIQGDIREIHEEEKYFLSVNLNDIKDKAILTITNKKGLKMEQQFTVKTKGDDHLLYYGKDEIKKMEDKGIFE